MARQPAPKRRTATDRNDLMRRIFISGSIGVVVGAYLAATLA